MKLLVSKSQTVQFNSCLTKDRVYTEGRRLKCNLSTLGSARRPDASSDCVLPREMMLAKLKVLTSDAMAKFTAAGSRMTVPGGLSFGPAPICANQALGLSDNDCWEVTFSPGSLCLTGVPRFTPRQMQGSASTWEFYLALDSITMSDDFSEEWKDWLLYDVQPMAWFTEANTAGYVRGKKSPATGVILFPSQLDCVYMATLAAKKMGFPKDKVKVLMLSFAADKLKSNQDTTSNALPSASLSIRMSLLN